MEETSKRPIVYEELQQLLSIIRRINNLNLERLEYDMIKMTMLFRPETINNSAVLNIVNLQDQSLIQLQNLCSRESYRLGRIMAALCSMCCLVHKGVLERFIFSSLSEEEIRSSLTRLLIYFSMEMSPDDM